MNWLQSVFNLFRRNRVDEELDEELRFHLDARARDNVRAGMDAASAKRDAKRRFGNAALAKERAHEMNIAVSLEAVGSDLRYAIRRLRNSPGFTMTAITMLALGLGASVAMFAFADAALFKPLPYMEPARLVGVFESDKVFDQVPLSYPDYLDWKRLNHSLQSLEVFGSGDGLLSLSTGAVPVTSSRVSDGFFRTLGVAPVVGRDFYAGEDRPGASNAVILSYGSWQKWYQGRAGAIGQTVVLDGVSATVVGVLPASFNFAPSGDTEFWLPLHANQPCDLRRNCHSLQGIARLRSGVTVQAALGEMKAIAAGLERQYPDSNRDQGANVVALSEVIVGDPRPILLTMLAGAGLLLAIACVNVSSLLVVRSEGRRKKRSPCGALLELRAVVC